MRNLQSKNRDGLFITKIFLFALVGTPALALGAVHTSVSGVYFVSAAGFSAYLFGVQKARAPFWDLPTGVGLGLLAFTVFQVIPLPSAVVSFIAPSVFEMRAEALLPLGLEPPSFMPLSLDVPFTLMEAGKLAFYLSVYWGVLFSVRRFGTDFVLRIIVISGALCAGIFLAHKILMLDKIYGLYTPLFVSAGRERMSAPLINENHMAAFLGLCAAAAVGRAAGRTQRSEKISAICTAAFIGGAVMLTLSRGGIAAFVAGQCLFVFMRIFVRKKEARDKERIAWLPLGVALSLGLGLFAARDALVGEFLDGNLKKLDLFVEGLALIERFWTVGAGRGAFWVVFHTVSGFGGDMAVTHAENAAIQLLSDWGVFVGGAALVSGLLIVGRFLVKPPVRAERAAALAALVAFGIHNFADFNMETMGVAVVAAALVGVLYGNESSRQRSAATKRIPLVFVWGTTATAAATAMLAFFYVRHHTVEADEGRLRQTLHEADTEVFTEKSLAEMMNRHPADAYIPFLAGVRFYHLKNKNPLPWFARAVRLYPFFADAHFYIGATLLRADRMNQAMLEFRLAVRADKTLADKAAALLVSRAPDFRVLSEIAPTDKDKRLLFPALARALFVRGFSKEAKLADKAILEIDPGNHASAARQIRRFMDSGAYAQALDLADRIERGPSAAVLKAEIYEKMKRTDSALAVLERGLQKFGDHPALLRQSAWTRYRAGDLEGALKAAALLKLKSANSEKRAQGALLEAKILIAARRTQSALARLREAHALDPDNEEILKTMFSAAKNHRDPRHALEAIRLLVRLKPSDASWQKELFAYENMLKARNVELENNSL